MRNKNSLLSLGILVLVLFLSVGYAVVSSVYVSIEGTANAAGADLNVEITDAVAVTNISEKTVDFNHVLSDSNLTSNFTLNNMTLGEIVTITYTVTNNETDVDAVLSLASGVALSNSNPNYFNVNYEITDASTDLENNDKTMTVVITVELIKTPVSEENSSTTVGLTLTASPAGADSGSGSSSLSTPLKLGEKYILTYAWGQGFVADPDSWIIYYEDGHSESKFGILGEEEIKVIDGFIYSGNNIYLSGNEDEDEVDVVSDDGKYLDMYDGSMILMSFILESEYNIAMSLPTKYGEKYYCIEDDVNSESASMVGASLVAYVDGSGILDFPFGDAQYFDRGTFKYSDDGIRWDDLPEYAKIHVADDGSTIIIRYYDQYDIVFALGSQLPISWNQADISGNTSVVIDGSVINDLHLDNLKFVKVSSSAPPLGFMLNTVMVGDVDDLTVDAYLDSVVAEENDAYIVKYRQNNQDESSAGFSLIVVPTPGEYFGSNFIESGIYVFDYVGSGTQINTANLEVKFKD